MARNDSIIPVLIDRAVANEIQEGFSLEVNTPDEGFNQAIYDMWWEWSNDPDQCDIAGEKCFNEFEIMASMAEKRDGDCLITCLSSGELQFIENHLIGTASQLNDVVLGVHLNEYRKHLGYHISKDNLCPAHIVSRGGMDDQLYIPARNEFGMRQAFHIYNNRRVTETRGVTALAPILKVSAMFEDVNFAKLVQQQIASAIVILRSRSQFSGGMVNSVSYGEEQNYTTATGEIQNQDGVQMGMELSSAPGEDISAFTSNIPNAEYFDHVRLLMQIMGVNFGLPLCLVLMDGSETNYSGWRGAVDEARKGFRMNQNNLIRKFHTPCYKMKLAQFLAEDPALRRAAADMGKKAFSHTWTPRGWAYIDPKADAEGDAFQIRNGLNSPRRIQQKNGRRWDDVARESIADNTMAIVEAKRQAAEINDQIQDGSPVSWRDLIALATPEGVNATMNLEPLSESDVDGSDVPNDEAEETADNG
jgi:lambda family phage portal protein